MGDSYIFFPIRYELGLVFGHLLLGVEQAAVDKGSSGDYNDDFRRGPDNRQGIFVLELSLLGVRVAAL